MATTTAAPGKPNILVVDKSFRQDIGARITSIIKAHFSSTIGQLGSDITKYILAQIQGESSFNYDRPGPSYSPSHISKVLGYSAVNTAYANGDQFLRANIINSIRALGLMQVTGYYLVKGAGPSGMAELARMRGDLWGSKVVKPGTDVTSLLTGLSTVDDQLLAGLTVLEDKYKTGVKVNHKGYHNIFEYTFGSYLGVGSDSLGTTPELYVQRIFGDNFNKANGEGIATFNKDSTKSGGPVTTYASGANLGVPGCA